MKHIAYVACAAVLLLAGCSGGDNTSTPPQVQQQPASWAVQAGASDSTQALQALQFYPATITIDEGDSVVWQYPAGEPHTVTFLGPKASPPPPSDPNDPVPAGGSTYDGSTYTSSGFMLLGQTYKLTFPKAGTYKYYCLIHGEMIGTVVVQPAGSKYPQSESEINGVISASSAADLKSASDSIALFPYATGGAHLAAGISPGLGQPPLTNASVVRFLDGPDAKDTSVTVPVGTTVTWTNLDTNLPHTVTIPPAGQGPPQMPPFAPPAGGTTYDGTTLVNSGPMIAGTPGASFSVTFTKAGTYTYYCLFHDDSENMIGTVVVQ
jgi:plastocyanin